MKAKLIYILVLINICFCTKAFDFVVYPQTSTPDFTIEDIAVGWYIPLQITTETFQGMRVTVEFSIGEETLNGTILSIGSKYESSIDYGLIFMEKGSYMTVRRHVRKGSQIGFYDADSWNKELFKKNTNYELIIEIDETRFRYSVAEKGKKPKYEYQFNGLNSTYLRERMVASGIAIAVNKRNYFIQSLRVNDLGYGVGVKAIVPQQGVRYGYIKNVHSGLYMRRHGSTNIGDYLEQLPISGSANDIWKIIPNFQSTRNSNQYDAIIENMYKNTFINPQNCSLSDDAAIYEASNSDCKEWSIVRPAKESDSFRLKNIHSNGYATVKNSSTEYNAQIIQNLLPEQGSDWKFEDLALQTPLESGFYTFRNLQSNKYMSVYRKVENGYVVQHSNDHSDSKVWYVEKQPEGTYTIKNIDTNQYLSVEDCSFAPGAYINVDNKSDFSCQKWIIDKTNNDYTIKSFASGKRLGIRYNSISEDEYLIQDNSQTSSFSWNIEPVTFDVGKSLGGVYQLKHAYTNLYLSVLNKSEQPHGYLITSQHADYNDAWWTLEEFDGGAYAIKNVRSQLYITIENRSDYENQYIIQDQIKPGTAIGHSLWHLWKSQVPAPDVYYFASVFDAKVMTVYNNTITPGEYIVQKTMEGSWPDPDLRMRWQLIPVERTTISSKTKSDYSNKETTPSPETGDIILYQVQNKFTVESRISNIKRIDVISINGQNIKRMYVNSKNSTIDLQGIRSGIYIFNIKLENNRNILKKISVKE